MTAAPRRKRAAQRRNRGAARSLEWFAASQHERSRATGAPDAAHRRGPFLKDSAMPSPNGPLVVVITGASSGIGRATAHAFAKRGASVVLAARRVPMLEEAARECEALGGTALAVPTDVTREDQVEELGRRALERFEIGRAHV